jgi:glyoxylate carboligase
MQILREQVKILKDDVGCTLVQSNYHEVVRGFGAEGEGMFGKCLKEGILIKDESELAEGLQTAKKIAKEKQVPVLVNVLIAKSDFREGSISV